MTSSGWVGRSTDGPRTKGRRQRLPAQVPRPARQEETHQELFVLTSQTTFDDLKHLIVNDYRNNGRKSLRHLEQVRLPKLADVFGGTKAIDVTTTAVERYKSLRLKDGAAPATLNRELAALHADCS